MNAMKGNSLRSTRSLKPGSEIVALLLTLAGCAAQPVPELNIPVASTWRHAPSPVAASPDLQGWWEAFDDPSLDNLVARARDGNLALHEAGERLLAARVLRAHARDAYLPYLRAHTENETDPDASASYLVSSFDAIWELGLFGRREGTHRMAQAGLDDAAAQLAGVEVSLIAEVVADHLLLGAAHERFALLTQIRSLQQNQLALEQVRENLGLAAPQQVVEAETLLARAQAAEASGRQQVDVIAEQLAVLLGLPTPDPDWIEHGTLPRLKARPLLTAPADLLRTRPEIRRAESAVLAAAGAADIARADRLPNIGIGGSIRVSTQVSTNDPPPSTFTIASIGPTVDIPLFDWGMRRAQVTARTHLLQAAVFGYRDAVLRGVAEVETALGSLQRDSEREARAETVSAAQHRGADFAAQRTTLQLASPLDRNAAALAAADAQIALIDARTEHDMAYVALYKALGGAPRPVQPPEKP
jgi:outer membrane protein, multidrug efflux system